MSHGDAGRVRGASEASAALRTSEPLQRPVVDPSAVRAALADDARWRVLFEEAETSGAGLHLGVFVEPYLRYVLEGRKTVESRFGVHRAPPFDCVIAGDLLLLKGASGPVTGIARISHVWMYRLSRSAWEEIRERFGSALCLDDEEAFVTSRRGSRFATLMRLTDVRPLRPIPVVKRDRRGWVVLRSAHAAPFLPGLDNEAV